MLNSKLRGQIYTSNLASVSFDFEPVGPNLDKRSLFRIFWIWAFGAKSIQAISLASVCFWIWAFGPLGPNLCKQSRFSILWFWACGAKSRQAISLQNLLNLSLRGQIYPSNLSRFRIFWIWAFGPLGPNLCKQSRFSMFLNLSPWG